MQPTTSQASVPYGRISFFFFLIYLVLTWGFFRTYLLFFPSFAGFKAVQHFHGAMMMTWMALLIVQPLLIKAGKLSIHRLIGRLSFIIAPVVIVSMFLITRFGYYKPAPLLSHSEKVGGLALQVIDILQFALFYCLAIFNRRNVHNHARYMIGTAIMMIGPGFSRGLGMYYQVSFKASIEYSFYVEMALAAAFLSSDLLGRKSFKANAIVLSVILVHFLLWEFRLYQPWQGIGAFVAGKLF